MDFTIEDKCYVNGKFIGTTIAKKITVNILNPDNAIDLENKEISAFAGIEINGITEETPFGNFIIDKPDNQEVQEKTSFVGYDYMIKFNIPYIDNNTYPISLQNFFSNLCTQVGLQASNETLVNGNYQILGNPFTNNETCRTVLSAIAELCGGFAKIGRDNKVYIVNLSNSTNYLNVEEVNLMTVQEVNNMIIENGSRPNVNETLDGNNYDTTFKKNNIWGKVNSLILQLNENIEGENTVRNDQTSIDINGLTEIVITGNEFLINETERELVIDDLWDTLKGLNYLPFSTDYYGYPYLDCGDMIKVLDNNDVEHYSYVFNHIFTYNGSFSGNLTTEALTKTQTQYKNTDVKTKFRNVELKVDKINGKIESVIEEIGDRTEKTTTITQDIDGIYQQVTKKLDLTNTVTAYTTITLQDVLPNTAPAKLRIFGNNTFGINENLKIQNGLILGKNVKLGSNQGAGLKINGILYTLGINEVLRQIGSIYDEYVYDYMANQAYVIRRVEVDTNNNLVVKQNETIENLPLPNFLFNVDGNNVLTLNKNANFELTYIMKNSYTSEFASKIEMNSTIKQTAEQIQSEVSQIYTTKDETNAINSTLTQRADSIEANVSENYTTKDEANTISSTLTQRSDSIEAKLHGKELTSEAVIGLINNRDGTSTATISADNINLNGAVTANQYFKINIDGSMEAIAGKIAGFNIGQHGLSGEGIYISSNGGTIINDLNLIYEEHQSGPEYGSPIVTKNGTSDINASIRHINIIGNGSGVNVTGHTTNFNIYASTSDPQLKKNIKSTKVNALDVINQIEHIQFNWKHDNKFQANGFNAQNLGKICDDFVDHVKQDYGEYEEILQVRDFNILPYITKAIQELSEENKQLKNTILDLTSRIEKLEKGGNS